MQEFGNSFNMHFLWQTRVVHGWLVAGQSVGAGSAYRLKAVCDMNSAAAAAVCSLWCYTSVIWLCLFWQPATRQQI